MDAAQIYSDAMGALSRGRTEEGTRGVTAALRSGLLPPHLVPDATANLGTAFSMLGRRAEAVVMYDASLVARPDSSLTLYNLGILRAEAGASAEAEQLYRRAIALPPAAGGRTTPQLGEVYNNLGTLLHLLDRRAEASTAFRSSIAVAPRHALAYNNLANGLKAVADAATTQLLGGQLDAATTQLLLSVGTQGGGGTDADAGGAQSGGALQVAGAQGGGNARLRLAARGAQREAVRAYCTALALHPAYPEAYRNLGSVLKERRATHSAAVRAYREATRLVPTDRASLLNLGELLQWLGRADAANVTYALAVSRGIWAHPQQRPSHIVPALEARPWWPTDTYSFVSTLLRHYREVRAEGLKLLREAQFDDYKSPALTSGRWEDVTLRLSGSMQPGARRAPRTAALLRDLGPQVTTMVSGAVYFSLMSPGARLRPHCGPTNSRLRVHLALSAPHGACGMRVGNESRLWRDGEVWVFDDSFEHEVWNDAETPRLLLILDAWHPGLTSEQQRHDALDTESSRRRYQTLLQRERQGLEPPMERDLVAERRVRTVY